MTLETLSHLSVVSIHGDDALNFLQGQLTNDVYQSQMTWQYSGYCSPKGRLIALLMLWQQNDTIYTLVDESLVDTFIKRLSMYVLRSKVNIEHQSTAHCFGCFDTGYHPELQNLEHGAIAMLDNQVTALSLGSRFLLIDTAGSLTGDHGNRWSQCNITEGIPSIESSSSELFIPQMVNLDILNGINFKKGCYTGQEIVARMHYLGKLKQRMVLCHADDSQHSASAGDRVVSDGKNVGTVVSAVPGSTQLLVVLRIDALNSVECQLSNGVSLQIASQQPYPLPELEH